MRYLFVMFVLAPFLVTAVSAQGLVNNVGSSGEDSLSVLVLSLDSLGRPTTSDSFYVVICKSDANGAIFRDSGNAAMSGLDTLTIAGQRYYYYHRPIADIDSAGAAGWYSGVITAKKNSGALLTPNRFSFQIVDRELSDALDSVGMGAGNSAKALDSLGKIITTLGTLETGGCNGSGAYAVTVIVYDSSTNQVVPEAELAIRNLDQSALIAVGMSNSSGRVNLNLDTASYLAISGAPGYIFSAFDTVTITGTGIDTVFGYRFDPGTPSSPTLCRVYGYLYGLSGTPEAGAAVGAYLPGGVVRSGELVVSPFAVTTVTDSAGYFFLDVIPSDSLTAGGTKYEFTIARQNGTILRQRVKVPSTTSWRLTW
ncbi:MAG: hypothetical protein AB1644_07180 [Candidatus Zixiibacteriota bacterium]